MIDPPNNDYQSSTTNYQTGSPCVVCVGAGNWDEMTGSPVFSKPPPAGTQRCSYCLGTAKARIPEEGAFR